MPPKINDNIYFKVNDETHEYAHVILSNMFSEPNVSSQNYENATRMLLDLQKNIVLDMRENVYIGKACVAFLVNLDCHLQETGHKMVLMSLKNRVLALLEYFGLNKIIKHIRSSDNITKAFDLKK
jgi:anti-anti-sigma regulatory factor